MYHIVPHSIHPEVSQEGALRQTASAGWRGVARSVSAARRGDVGRPRDGRPHSRVLEHPAEIERVAGHRFFERQECGDNPPSFSGPSADDGTTLLGTRLLREHGGPGRSHRVRLHPAAGEARSRASRVGIRINIPMSSKGAFPTWVPPLKGRPLCGWSITVEAVSC